MQCEFARLEGKVTHSAVRIFSRKYTVTPSEEGDLIIKGEDRLFPVTDG